MRRKIARFAARTTAALVVAAGAGYVIAWEIDRLVLGSTPPYRKAHR